MFEHRDNYCQVWAQAAYVGFVSNPKEQKYSSDVSKFHLFSREVKTENLEFSILSLFRPIFYLIFPQQLYNKGLRARHRIQAKMLDLETKVCMKN